MEKEFKFDVGDVVRLPGNHVGTTAGEVFTVEKRWHGMTGEDAYLLRSTTRKHVAIDANGYHMSKVECEICSSDAKEGETFSDVAKKVDDFKCAGFIHASRVLYIVKDIGKRFTEAHEREVADLRRCLKEAVDDYFKNQCPRCAGCRSTIRCEYKGWKAVLEKYTKSEGESNGK